jgi:HD-like signal output (HDOD) protein
VSRPRDIDYLLEEVVTLPSLPRTVTHITQLVSDPNCSLAMVAKAVSSDPAIALKTLRLVNSAFYGLRQQVATVEHAVVLLGMKVIRNLVFTATVFDTLKSGVDTLLKHSVSCGVAMRVLVERGKNIPVEYVEEAFIYGLLHDIGMILFEQFLPREHALVSAACSARKIPRYQAEREIIGVDHAMVGMRLAHKWRLPDNIVHVIAGHHELDQCANAAMKPVSATLAIADYVCTACGLSSYEDSVVRVEEQVWESAGFSNEEIPGILEAFFEAFPSIEELVKLTL